MTDTVFPWTFDAAFVDPNWKIGGAGAATVTSEVATHRRLTLQFRVTTAVLTSVLRPLKSNEGQVDVLTTDDGGFVAVDRADGANTYTLDPRDVRKPLRQAGDYHVRRYEEDLVSQTVDEWQVEVEFVRGRDRSDTPSIDEAPSGAAFPWAFDQAFTDRGEWGLTTRYGTIATARVDADFLGTGADGVERFELTARLTVEQALAFEAALSLLDGSRVRQIPDATNVMVDDTDGDANTVTVDPPTTGDEVPTGEYVVTGWEGRRLNGAFGEYAITLADAG